MILLLSVLQQTNVVLVDDQRKLKLVPDNIVSSSRGATLPFRNKMERTLLAQFQRLPGLPSNLVGLEAHLDLDETLE